MPTSLPTPTNLEFVKKQSKDLRKAFAEGDSEALQRIRDHLPRARQLGEDDLRSLDLSLQEAQHALACEYGFAKWEELLAALELPRFEDLARISDQELEFLVLRVQQRDLVFALLDTSEAVTDRLLSKLSERVRWWIRTEMDFVDMPPAGRVEEARQRILAYAIELSERGRVTWPPAKESPTPSTGPPAASAPQESRLARISAPLVDLTPDELLSILVGLVEEARREGILYLGRYLVQSEGTLLTEALRLALDGTEPELMLELLENRASTILRSRTMKAHMAIEGWLSIHRSDNPMFVQQKMENLFVEAHELASGSLSNPTAGELTQRLQDTPASHMTPSQMVSFYRGLAFLRRQQGLPALLDVVEAIDDPVLATGIRASGEEGCEAQEIMEVMSARAQEERLELHRRHRMVIEGILGMNAGHNPMYLEEHVVKATEKSVAELAARGFPIHGE